MAKQVYSVLAEEKDGMTREGLIPLAENKTTTTLFLPGLNQDFVKY